MPIIVVGTVIGLICHPFSKTHSVGMLAINGISPGKAGAPLPSASKADHKPKVGPLPPVSQEDLDEFFYPHITNETLLEGARPEDILSPEVLEEGANTIAKLIHSRRYQSKAKRKMKKYYDQTIKKEFKMLLLEDYLDAQKDSRACDKLKTFAILAYMVLRGDITAFREGYATNFSVIYLGTEKLGSQHLSNFITLETLKDPEGRISFGPSATAL